MKFEDKGCAEGRGADGHGTGDSEALLRAEISFWRELLQECNDSVPAASIERMRQALALAEHRFLRLGVEARARGRSSDCPRQTCPVNPKHLH